ncbi:signal recognition particle protein [Candidatus Bathyarchaeota archaeon]|nr:signal recognition particle protein [Candidatus Bathyarchaeota archaeon]
MVLEKLGESLHNALAKIFKSSMVDKKLVKELVIDIQRALLQADVNVKLVFEISRRIEERALNEKVPPGISRREHILKVVYEELTRFLGEKPKPLNLKPGGENLLMLVGIQGSGKTTTAAKLARYYQKRGFKTALICSDTYRPGALAQLRQLAEKINVPVYGDETEKNPVKIVKDGIEKFRGYDLIIIDTSGRHKEEKGLIEEMKKLEEAIKPDEVMLVIDGTIGQQAAVQAEAFNKATPIGSIFVSKLDGSARGGGALSSVAAIGAPIKFIGTGEKLDDIEPFVPSRFVGRLLGLGDLKGLVEKVREAEVKVPEKDVKAFLSGKFTLYDMYKQFESLRKVGPIGKLLRMVPGFAYDVPEETLKLAEKRLDKWKAIIESMTLEERMNPKIFNSSRVRRVARGSGTSEAEVRELLKQYNLMRKMMKSLRRKRLPFFKGGFMPR